MITETLRVELQLHLATRFEHAEVASDPLMVQGDTSALGRVVDERAVSGLPLVTRNFAQIIGLSPGVLVGVYNAGELGLGGTALSQIAKSNDGSYVHGARSYGNNFRVDGISVSDVQAVLLAVAESRYPTPTAYRNSKSRPDCTTQLMDAMGALASVWLRKPAKTIFMGRFSSLSVMKFLTPTISF